MRGPAEDISSLFSTEEGMMVLRDLEEESGIKLKLTRLKSKGNYCWSGVPPHQHSLSVNFNVRSLSSDTSRSRSIVEFPNRGRGTPKIPPELISCVHSMSGLRSHTNSIASTTD